jgi:uncharacterized protein (TIGR02285 family)
VQKNKTSYFLLSLFIFSGIFIPKIVWSSAPPKYEEILWLVEDTYEWADYEKGISVSTSQDTATIIITALLGANYKLSFVKASGERINHFLKNNDNACISNRIKTPAREEYSLYSTPHDIYLGLQIYRLKQKEPLAYALFDSQGEITHLADIFNYYPANTLGVSGGISYGVEIDQQLQLLKEENLFVRSGGLRLQSLVNMFFKKRIDYVIYYPTDMDKLLKSTSIEIESYKLAETPAYLAGHVTCSKSIFGKKVIKKINHILTNAYKTEEFYNAHAKWVPTSDLKTLNHYFNEVFLKKSVDKSTNE